MLTSNDCRLAGIRDIAAMKIAAIINRGTKKRFYRSVFSSSDLFVRGYPRIL